MRHIAAVIGLLLLSGGQPALARSLAPFMPMGSVADAPQGFVEMCATGDPACATRPAPGSAAAAAPDGARRLIGRINRAVNRRVTQRSDRELYKVDELWRAAGAGTDATGDCEDIALQKRAELIAAGLNEAQLLLATAYIAGTGLHTVLIVRLGDGDYVLDSLGPSVARWDQVGYSWLRVQVPGHPGEWRRVGTV